VKTQIQFLLFKKTHYIKTVTASQTYETLFKKSNAKIANLVGKNFLHLLI